MEDDMRIFGYTRVSTDNQTLETQEALIKTSYPDAVIRGEKISSVSEKPVLGSLIDDLRKGDTLVVYKLDRLSRSLLGAAKLIHGDLIPRGVKIVSIMDNIDTSTASGRMHLNMLLVIADHERDLISERTKARLQKLKDDGKTLGRPRRATLSADQIQFVVDLRTEHKLSFNDISIQFNETYGIQYSDAYFKKLYYKNSDKRQRYKSRKYLRA
jgi:DNA invertase Pin-like site-specific DNA recombinase